VPGRVRVRLARNGDIFRGAFIIDAYDREIIAWRAVVNAGISGSDIRDIMLEAVERRFGGHRAPAVIDMLSDNGSPYIAKDTKIFARQLGLKSCFTPVKSPQSHGIAEAFVKTLKPDHVHVTPLPGAATVLGLIAGWIEDDNENHPHSGLKMCSPCEFIAAQTATAQVSGRTGARPPTRQELVNLSEGYRPRIKPSFSRIGDRSDVEIVRREEFRDKTEQAACTDAVRFRRGLRITVARSVPR
jgi:transposase InsO family protein